jgi:hypothetical protein
MIPSMIDRYKSLPNNYVPTMVDAMGGSMDPHVKVE